MDKITKPLKFSDYRLQNATWLQQEYNFKHKQNRFINFYEFIVDSYAEYLNITGCVDKTLVGVLQGTITLYDEYYIHYSDNVIKNLN